VIIPSLFNSGLSDFRHYLHNKPVGNALVRFQEEVPINPAGKICSSFTRAQGSAILLCSEKMSLASLTVRTSFSSRNIDAFGFHTGEIDIDAHLQHRRGDHENNQQH